MSPIVLCVFFLVSSTLLVDSYQERRLNIRRMRSRQNFIAGSYRCASDMTSSEEVTEEFEKKIRNAQFVFTGKVVNITDNGQDLPSLQIDGSGRDFSLDAKTEKALAVRIKRALKGTLPGSPADVELTKPHTHQMVHVVVGRHVGGEKNRCYHMLRVHHTAIFLADNSSGGEGTFQLVSSPLALTLRNLDRVNAAVKDMFYKPRSPIIEEPCEKTYCAFGANCVMDSSGRAHCQCPVDCPSVFTPVCGTDGITYSNHCMLRKKSCQSEENTRVQHAGECGARDTSDGRRQ